MAKFNSLGEYKCVFIERLFSNLISHIGIHFIIRKEDKTKIYESSGKSVKSNSVLAARYLNLSNTGRSSVLLVIGFFALKY